MKKFAFLLIIVGFISLYWLIPMSCAKKQPEVMPDDFLKIPEYSTTESSETRLSPTITHSRSSYWFIVVEDKDGSQKFNSFIEQDHKYFSASEAKATFTKDVFIINIVEVSKETYEKNNE